MNGNAELLNYIFQNTEMGVNTLSQITDITKDSNFRDQLEKQTQGYTDLHTKTKDKLHEMNKDEKSIGKLSEIGTYLMVNMQTLTDKTTTHLAEMLINGSTMGIIQVTRKMKEYPNADPDVYALADSLLKFEEGNVHSLKTYL